MKLQPDPAVSAVQRASSATPHLSARCRELVQLIMHDSETPELDRLIALVAEAEQILAKSIASHDIRHACALARGYLDLARDYHEPVKVAEVERVLKRMRALLKSNQADAPDFGFHPGKLEG